MSRQPAVVSESTGGRRVREAPQMAEFLARMARAMVRRAAAGDLQTLSALLEARTAITVALADAARAAHDHGYSWTEVGAELGMSRQAARQQYGQQLDQ